MSKWRSVTDPPNGQLGVLLYSQSLEIREYRTDELYEDEPHEGLRFEVGYWDNGKLRYSGSNHLVFEWDGPGVDPHKPTHWLALPDPPEPPEMSTRIKSNPVLECIPETVK